MTSPAPRPKPASKRLGFLLDYGPLLIFFIAYKIWGAMVGTAVFMLASVIAAGISWGMRGRVTPMQWLSTGLVLVFGGLTLALQDQSFIQIKATMIYALLGTALLVGLAFGRPLLKIMFEFGFEGLSDRGWWKLSRNWGLFFLAMAVLNEAMRYTISFDHWMTAKVTVIPALSFLFIFIQIPMMMREGLGQETDDENRPAS